MPGRGSYREGVNTGDRRCYKCDKPEFTREHMNEYAAKNVTCIFVEKSGILNGRAGQRKTIVGVHHWE